MKGFASNFYKSGNSITRASTWPTEQRCSNEKYQSLRQEIFTKKIPEDTKKNEELWLGSTMSYVDQAVDSSNTMLAKIEGVAG